MIMKNCLCTTSLFIITTLLIFQISASAQVVINEYSASNLEDYTDNYSCYEDWVELYNSGSSTIDLSGYYLSDKLSNPTKWEIPSGLSIDAGDYKVIWVSGRDEVLGNNYHTNFKFTQTKSGTEYIVLSDPSGALIEQHELEITQLGHSRGRTPSGFNTWSVFTDPTPGSSNNSSTPYTRYADKPVMELPAGFYSNSLVISISTPEPDAEIHYTTSGSDPTSSSGTYTSPFTIYSTKIVKARTYSNDPDILPSLIEFNTYFIDVSHTLAVISVSGGSSLTNLLNGNQYLRPKGTAEYFNISGVRTTHGYGEFNEHGQDSWVHDQRSIDYVTRDECGYNYALQEKLLTLSDRDEFQRIILRASGDDNYPGIDTSAHLRDMYIQKMACYNDLHLDMRRAERCILYVNGSYWGVYSIREKVNDHDYTDFYYDQGKYDIQYIMLWGNTWVEYGGQTAMDQWDDLWDFIVNNDMSNTANYEYAISKYNYKSLVDYVLYNSWVVCSDWLNWNVGWWRGLNPDGDHKKWGYQLWDEDATFGHYINYTGIPGQNPYVDPCFPEDISGSSDPEGHIVILNSLLDNPEFEQYYISRYADLLNTAFDCEFMINFLDSMASIIEPEMPQHIQRWGGSFSEWQNNVQKIRDFINTRCEIINDGLIDCYDITGPYQLMVMVDPINTGEVKINSINPDQYPWQGEYFGDINILLEAEVMDPYYEFDRWLLHNHTVSPYDTSTEASLNLTQNDTLIALFKPLEYNDTLVINEINYNSSDYFNPGDWVEFFNPNDYELDISDWVFKDEDDLHSFIFPPETTIEPFGFLVLCNDTAAFKYLFPEVSNFIGEMGFGLSGSGEVIRIFDSTGQLLDMVLYDDQAPWPLEPDGSGPTLELLDAQLDNSLPESWIVCDGHGTPGEENCDNTVILDEEIEQGNISISIFPNPATGSAWVIIYSPDQIVDGELEIYNSLGQKVKHIKNINTKKLMINRDNLPEGLYICKFTDRKHNHTASEKLMIK